MSANVDDLPAFLRARWDEDEQDATAASPGPWKANAEQDEVQAVDDIEVATGFALSSNQLRATVRHIVRHNPARVLREVEAKRRILDEHKQGRYGECVTCDVGAQSCGCCGWGDFPCSTIRLLVLPYADHEGYREEWKS